MDRTLLPAIAAFVEVARLSNFSKAATVLNVSPSALSQIIRGLEARLDVRLLNRSTRSVSLTEDGRILLKKIAPALETISQAILDISDARAEPEGLVRINTSRFAARLLLEPHLGNLSQRYPKIQLEIIADDGLSSVIADGCDAGIRLREAVTDTMIGIPISRPMILNVAGSPDYFARYGTPETPEDLKHHNCIAFRPNQSKKPYFWEFSDTSSGRDFSIEPTGGANRQ